MGKKLDIFVFKDKIYIICNLIFFFKFFLYDWLFKKLYVYVEINLNILKLRNFFCF